MLNKYPRFLSQAYVLGESRLTKESGFSIRLIVYQVVLRHNRASYLIYEEFNMKVWVIAFLALLLPFTSFAQNKVINTTKAPAAIGPYSQAIATKDYVFVSGQIPIDPKTGTLQFFEGDIKKQTQLVLSNIEAILKEAGCQKTDIVKVTMLLSDIKDFEEVNVAYADFFGTHKPARSTFAVTLPKGAEIEIEAIAACKGK